VTRRAGPLGAIIYAEPKRGARQVGIIPAWFEVVGEVVTGESIHGNPFWRKVQGVVWDGRTVEDIPPSPPSKRRGVRRERDKTVPKGATVTVREPVGDELSAATDYLVLCLRALLSVNDDLAAAAFREALGDWMASLITRCATQSSGFIPILNDKIDHLGERLATLEHPGE
jgi:hypothetical protein